MEYDYCSEHNTKRPCDDCSKRVDRYYELLESGPYIHVVENDLMKLVVRVTDKLAEGYKPLGPPQVVVYANTHKSTDNFGAMSTNFDTRYMQFMYKEAD